MIINYIRKHSKTIFVFIIVIGLFLLVLLFTKISGNDTGEKIEASLNQSEETKELTCDRAMRLENDPEIDRALSIIYQRLNDTGEISRFGIFSPELVNCIKVEVKNIKNEFNVEGYFDPTNPEIKSNYFPIVIDSWGSYFADDLITTMLLVHEITHVKQHIKNHNLSNSSVLFLKSLALSSETEIGCFNNEVDAFMSQIYFMYNLKEEERKSINLRLTNDTNLHPQLQTLKYLKDSLSLLNIDGCEKLDTFCIRGKVYGQIMNILENEDSYIKQCGVFDKN